MRRSLNKLSKRDQSGFALIIVLLVIVILSTLVVEFLFSSNVNMSLAALYKERMKARYLAIGGVNSFEGLLRTGNFPGKDYAAGYCYIGVGCNDMFAPDPFAGMDFPDLSRGTWGVGVTDFALTEGETFKAIITDERSRLNLNAIVRFNLMDSHDDKKDDHVYNRIKALFMLVAETDKEIQIGESEAGEICDALVDWIDRNQDGPFENAYAGLPEPYGPRNGPMQTVGEIKLVRGMTDRLYDAVKDYLTVYPMKPKTDVFYDYRISFDHAPKAVLAAFFYGFTDPGTGTPLLSSAEALDLAEDLIAERDELTSPMSVQKVQSIAAKFSIGQGPVFQKFFFRSNKGSQNYFRLTATGMIRDVTTEIVTVMQVAPGNKIKRLYWKER